MQIVYHCIILSSHDSSLALTLLIGTSWSHKWLLNMKFSIIRSFEFFCYQFNQQLKYFKGIKHFILQVISYV